MTIFGYVLLTAGIAALITVLVAGKGLDYRTRSCPPAVESQITCVTAEPAPFLNRDEGPEQRPEFVHVASPDIDAATTPTAGPLPFFDFTPMPSVRMLPTINRAAVLAMMNQGNELPPGFQFASSGFPR